MSRAFYKPIMLVEAWLTLQRFHLLMAAVGEATLEMTGGKNWSDPPKFFVSNPGAEYCCRLHEKVLALIRTPGPLLA